MVTPDQGTLTIVFTDVERSTELLERVGDAEWIAGMRRHEDTINRFATEHGGRVVKGLGDGFMLAFPSARRAVDCALDVLAESGDLRVRIGIHAGETSAVGDDLYGRAVVKAARIAGAARGGEALASALVRELADDGDPQIIWDEGTSTVLKGLDGRHVLHRVQRAAVDGRPVIRLVIADDAAIVRDGLAALLRAAGLQVDAVASDGETLVAAVDEYEPDVVITDIRMPPTHSDEGLVAAERIRTEHPTTGVLVLSQHVEPALAIRLFEGAGAGGKGYLLKDRVTDLELLLDAIRRVRDGGTVVDPDVSKRMVSSRSGELEALTQRELEVLRMIAEGHSNRAIAEQLFVTPKTLEGHISQIFLKLGLHDAATEHRRVAAVLAYLRRRVPRSSDAPDAT